jgi:hypothetical protein
VAGHVAELRVEVQHLLGEQVFPGGVELAEDAPERALLERAHFRLPDRASAVRPELERVEQGARATTTLVLPLIPLPPSAGRAELELPPLPIAIARASGHVQTLCTPALRMLVEDPLASVAEAAPRPDPPPRPQREIWWAARNAVLYALGALPIAALALLGLNTLRRRLRRPPAPPSPRPAWEVALEELRLLESARLLEAGEVERHLDQTVHVLRQYLGARYGFVALESTTRELLRELGERAPGFPQRLEVQSLLERSDLVKFARRLPTHEECREALASVRETVQKTMPAPSLDPRLASGRGVGAGGSSSSPGGAR